MILNHKQLPTVSKAIHKIVALVKIGIRSIKVGIPVLIFIHSWGPAFKFKTGNEYQSKTS